MKLQLVRMTFTEASTIGKLSIDGVYECVTLERPDLDNAPDVACIPDGVYAVRLAHSQRFQRTVPHLLDVPGRSDIEMHMGNTAEDVHGCIAVGAYAARDFVGSSLTAFDNLMRKLMVAADMTIEVTRVKDVR